MTTEFDDTDDDEDEVEAKEPLPNNRSLVGGRVGGSIGQQQQQPGNLREDNNVMSEEDVDSDEVDYGISGDVTVMPKIVVAAAAANAEMKREQQRGNQGDGGASGE